MRAIAFNGKFRAGRHNGVSRVAERLIREVDTLLAAMPAAARPPVHVIVPANCPPLAPLRVIGVETDSRPASQAWEQCRLPRLARGRLLVNLANLAPVLHRPKVTMLHDAQFFRADCSYPWRQRIGYRWLVPWMARTSRRVLTISAFAREDLGRHRAIGAGQGDIVHNGADHILEMAPRPGALAELGLAPGGYLLLFGSIKAYKNNAVVFAALTGAPAGSRPLVVVGPGEGALRAAGLAPPPGTVFVGGCDDATLRALYEGAWALLFPSRTEGFGLPPVEAMLCGCPVVAAPCGAVPEVCGAAALMADPDDPASWCAQIAALDDPQARAALVEAGRERAARYTWAEAGRRLLDLLLAAAR